MNVIKTIAGIAMLLTLLFCFSSCEKEAVSPASQIEGGKTIADYPDKITMDNWEEFIYAPQEVIDYHNDLETGNLDANTKKVSDRANAKGGNCGLIRIFSGGTPTALPGVNVRILYDGYTDISTTQGYTIPSNIEYGGICLDMPNVDPLNGVNVIDMLFVQRHVLEITPFLNVRQWLGADIDQSGIIDQNDVELLRDILLGRTLNFQENIFFVTERNYGFLQDVLNTRNYPPILGLSLRDCDEISCSTCPLEVDDFRAIKTGDVDGDYDLDGN